MKIAFLTPEYPHSATGHSGGIGTSIKNLGIALKQLGCSVRILVYGQNTDEVFEDNGLSVHRIKNVKRKGLSWFLTRKKLERIIDELYAAGEIDLVEAPDWTGITSFIRPKLCPVVIRLNGSDTYFCNLENRPVKWHNRFHEKKALQKADGLISVSRFTADKTNEVFGLNKNFTIIPNGINVSLFHDNFVPNDSPSSGRGRGEDIILYFGSLIRKKGLLDLPLIFNEVVRHKPNAQLILVGRDVPDIKTGNSSTWGLMRGMFSEQAKKQVQYQGAVPYDKVKEHIAKAAVCVFPSYAEALPVSWLEAMAMEKAVVASNVGWATEMILEGESGFLVHPSHHQLFADNIVTLLTDAEFRSNMGQQARARVLEQFSNEVVAQNSLAFFRQFVRT